MAIEPKDKVTREDQRLKLPADVVADLRAYEVYLKGYSIDEIVALSLRQTMASDRPFQGWLKDHPEARTVVEKKGKKPAPLQVMAAAGGQ